MKKTISILLIVTMLLSMIVLPTFNVAAADNAQSSGTNSTNTIGNIAANAGTDMTKWPEQPGSNAVTDPTYSNIGNTVVSKTNADYKASLAAEGYIPIVAAKGEGKPENAVLLSEISGTDGNKYYLYEDITSNSASVGGKAKNITIDGCGHTITISAPLFDNPTNVTVKNITFTGSIVCGNYHNKKSGSFSILNQWGSTGWVKAYNLTLDVDISSTNVSGSQHAAQLAIYAGSGSVFENILATGDLSLGLNTYAEYAGEGKEQIQEIGGIVGDVSGATFKNVVNRGKIIIGNGTDAMSLKVNNNGIGGIVGVAGSSVTFESCFYEGAITIKDKTVISTDFYIGGIVGKMSGSSVKKSMNKGNISVSEDANTATRAHLGGLIGYANVFVNVENSVNEGNISSAKSISTGDPVGTIGGIIGYFDNGANFYLCRNNGNLSNSVDKYNIGGIAGWGKGNKAFSHCINNGNVSMTWKSANQAGAAGICGYSQTGTVSMYHCENTGAIKLTSGGGTNLYTGGLLGRSVNTAITVDYCKNTGEIVGCTTAKGYNPVGGLISGIQYNGSTTTNTLITISYSVNNGSVKGYIVGGIMGAVSNDNNNNVIGVKISDCINDTNGAVTGTLIAGGIVGSNTRDVNTTGGATYDIDNCVNKGTITCANDTAGGILGYANRVFYLDNSVNEGTIDAKWGGGVIGYIKTDANVSGLVNLGNVTSAKSGGGILGHTTAGATFKDCVNGQKDTTKGKIYTTASEGSAHGTGGIVGFVTNDAVFEGVINYGEVTSVAEADKAAKYMGGIVGRISGKIYAGYTIESAKTANRVQGNTCYNFGQITVNGIFNNDHINPIAGLYAHGIKGGYIANSENHGDIVLNGTHIYSKGTKAAAGGIVGAPADSDGSNTLIENCKNYGDIYNGNTDGKLIKWAAGGIMGCNFSKNSNVELKNCENYGDIADIYVAGGITGRGYTGAATYTNCKNYGTISNSLCYDEVRQNNVPASFGGILGYSADDSVSTKFENCVNSGEINISGAANTYVSGGKDTNYAGHVGGIIGFTNKPVEFINCSNDGDIAVTAEKYHVGGLGGSLDGTTKTVTNCTNTGDISVLKDEAGVMVGIAGLIGYANGGTATITYSVNDGNVTINGAGNETRVGGIIGRVANNATITVEYCINNGDITAPDATKSGNHMAGIIGNIQTWNSPDTYKVVISNTVNYGEVSGYVAAGFVGFGYPDSDNGTYNVGVEITESVNNGNISGTEIAAGFVGGALRSSFHVTVRDSANAGDINGNNAGGVIGRISYVNATLANIANIGTVSGSTTNGIAADGDITNCVSSGNGITASQALEALQGTNLVAFTTEVFDATVDRAQNIVDTKDPNKYVVDTWNRMIEKLEAAKTFKQNKLTDFDPDNLFVTNADGSFSKILAQAEINVYERALAEAIDGLWTINILLNNVNTMIAEAEIIENDYYNGKVIYTPNTWDAFMNTLNALKEAALLGDDLTWDIAKPAMAAMETATNNLVKGGTIYDADDFYALDGVDGTFTLAADITISRPLGELKATILGNGKTITLDGCAIAQSTDSASITNFKVEGTAGEATSLLGAASGRVDVKGAVINADAFTSAVIFDSVAYSADVTTYDIISYADAPLFMAGVKSEEVSIAGVLVMGEAEGLTDNDDMIEAELAYVNGVVYYDGEGEQTKSEQVFASGKVAYEMNESFKKYSSDYSIGEFGGTILTQKLDGTSLPTTSKESVDGSNVIVSDGKGGFVNLFTPVLPPVIGTPDEDQTPVDIDLTALKAAIAAAKKLDSSKYTAASWTVVMSYVSEAEAALGAKTQNAVDNATTKLNAVLAALEEKTEAAPAAKLDYTKLDEAIAKAAALKADGYSDGTWSILQTMIALANSAKKNALNQARIDQAVAGLDAAIAGLKAPVVEEAPVVDNKTDKTPEKEEDGCGSVVGGVAVMAVAVMALGAGVSFKKKED